jgi:periplasmic divalent cation tolerance protein
VTDQAAFLYSTFPSVEAARAASHALLEARLVACCTILPAAESLYWWEGKITNAAETILLCKTAPHHLTAAAAQLETLHPYDCPAILRWTTQANAPYAAWLTEETGQKPSL